jgi:aminopeptidase
MDILQKYAHLLVNYSLDLKKGDRLYVQTTTLAEPLVRELYRETLKAGAIMEVDFAFREKNRIFMTEAEAHQLQYISPLFKAAMEEFEAYLFIRAPFNLHEDKNIDKSKSRIRQLATADLSRRYTERTGTRALKRSLCQYPTDAAAQEAGMSLEEYSQFVYNACKLYEPDPQAAWLEVRKNQQHIVDFLNKCRNIHYKSPHMDLKFSCEGRIWMNSDGQTNMPSGEVYTSPVENSVNGRVHFTMTSLYGGNEVEGVTLWVKDGYIERWDARRNKEFLDMIFQVQGARRFGEAAIGTNYGITKITKNILFDEKIGGTVHLAVGNSYPQTGGKNESPVHWDMITDMREGGEIYADNILIYKNGLFVI